MSSQGFGGREISNELDDYASRRHIPRIIIFIADTLISLTAYMSLDWVVVVTSGSSLIYSLWKRGIRSIFRFRSARVSARVGPRSTGAGRLPRMKDPSCS